MHNQCEQNVRAIAVNIELMNISQHDVIQTVLRRHVVPSNHVTHEHIMFRPIRIASLRIQSTANWLWLRQFVEHWITFNTKNTNSNMNQFDYQTLVYTGLLILCIFMFNEYTNTLLHVNWYWLQKSIGTFLIAVFNFETRCMMNDQTACFWVWCWLGNIVSFVSLTNRHFIEDSHDGLRIWSMVRNVCAESLVRLIVSVREYYMW